MEGQVNYLNFITRGSVLGFSFIISKSSKEVLFPKTAKRPLSYSVQQSKKNQSPRIKKFSINVIPQIIFSTFNSIAFSLTVPVPCISESCVKIKINLNFYFHTSFPTFQATPPLYWFFVTPLPPPLKIAFVSESQNILKFCKSLTPAYILKVTKFLVEIPRFEFLVMREKNISVYKL